MISSVLCQKQKKAGSPEELPAAIDHYKFIINFELFSH